MNTCHFFMDNFFILCKQCYWATSTHFISIHLMKEQVVSLKCRLQRIKKLFSIKKGKVSSSLSKCFRIPEKAFPKYLASHGQFGMSSSIMILPSMERELFLSVSE